MVNPPILIHRLAPFTTTPIDGTNVKNRPSRERPKRSKLNLLKTSLLNLDISNVKKLPIPKKANGERVLQIDYSKEL